MEANSNGRPTAARTASATAASTASVVTCPAVMPRKLPNSNALVPLRNPLYSATNSIPLASANACTVPMTADCSL